jgi:hypothetical protein
LFLILSFSFSVNNSISSVYPPSSFSLPTLKKSKTYFWKGAFDTYYDPKFYFSSLDFLTAAFTASSKVNPSILISGRLASL